MSTMIMLGLGVAAVGFGGKALVQIAKQMKPLSVKIPKLNMVCLHYRRCNLFSSKISNNLTITSFSCFLICAECWRC
eukprot:m.32068 g.32068  ORF g.32068 m.32068 type:complete len:77 (+) comp9752_c0_seq3:113-343(+)